MIVFGIIQLQKEPLKTFTGIDLSTGGDSTSVTISVGGVNRLVTFIDGRVSAVDIQRQLMADLQKMMKS